MASPFFVQTARQVAHSSGGHVYAGPLADGYWIDAADRRAGDRLLNDDSSRAEVVSSRTLAQPLRAYNLTVKDFHTYFVAANENAAPVWVHNICGPRLGRTIPGNVISEADRVKKTSLEPQPGKVLAMMAVAR